MLAWKNFSISASSKFCKKPTASIGKTQNSSTALSRANLFQKPKAFVTLASSKMNNNKNNSLALLFQHTNKQKFNKFFESFEHSPNFAMVSTDNSRGTFAWLSFFLAVGFFSISNVLSDDELELDEQWKTRAKKVNLPAGKYWGELNDKNQPEGFGEMMFESTKDIPKAVTPGTIYKGYWKNGKMDGFGKVMTDDGSVLITKFKENEPTSFQAFMCDPAGSFVWAEKMVNGSFQGKVLISDVFNYFDGNFGDEGPEGYGKLLEDDGTYYEGEFFRGQRYGKGRMTSPDPLNLELEGTFQDGTLWEGAAVNRNFTPPLRVRVTKGEMNVEELKLDLEREEKAQENPPEPKFVGTLDSEGKFHGKGISYEYAPTTPLEAEMGKFGTIIYEGNYQHGQRQGPGKVQILDSHSKIISELQGDFENDRLHHGTSIIYSFSGAIVEIEVERGAPKGRKVTLQEGKVMRAVWNYQEVMEEIKRGKGLPKQERKRK